MTTTKTFPFNRHDRTNMSSSSRFFFGSLGNMTRFLPRSLLPHQRNKNAFVNAIIYKFIRINDGFDGKEAKGNVNENCFFRQHCCRGEILFVFIIFKYVFSSLAVHFSFSSELIMCVRVRRIAFGNPS